MRLQEAVSIGIIGGADGPTAIYVSASPLASLAGCVLAVVGIGCLAALLIFVVRRHRKKRN